MLSIDQLLKKSLRNRQSITTVVQLILALFSTFVLHHQTWHGFQMTPQTLNCTCTSTRTQTLVDAAVENQRKSLPESYYHTNMASAICTFDHSSIYCLSTTGEWNYRARLVHQYSERRPMISCSFDYIKIGPGRVGEKNNFLLLCAHFNYCWLYMASATTTNQASN